MHKIWAKICVISLLTVGLIIPTATPWGISEANAARPSAINGTYTTYSFPSAITGATGNGSQVTFNFTTQTGTGSDWRVGDFITITFPSSNATTTAYNLGQVAITAITANTITVASAVKVEAKYPNTVALTGLTSSSTGIQAGTLTVTRDPNTGSTPNGCSLGGTMTIAFGTNYLVPKYTSLGQAVNGSGVKIAAGSESVDQGIYANTYQENKTVNGTVVSSLASCKGTLYIPEGVKSLSSSGQSLVTNIAFPSSIDVVQSNALSGYTSLVSLNLDPVKYLMSSAFTSGCNISSLSLGSTFEFFGKGALGGCANLTSVALPASIRSLGEWTFGGSAVTYFDLPASFTCTEPGFMQESGCDWKIGQYFFGGQSGQTTLAPSIKINLANIQSASTKLALEHYLGVQTLRGTVSLANDPNCTTANSCKTTTFVANPSGNLIADAFGRTGMGYNVGNFPSVVFTQNSDQGPEKTFTQSVTSGANTQLSAVSSMSFSKSNNSFAGWNTAANGSGTTYLDAASINITSTLYLYAQWSPIYTYTVNLNPGTGGTGTQMTAMTGTAAIVKLNANTYSRTGYTFNGWNTAEDGTGSSYINQGTVRLTVDNQTVTLYAQWLIVTYTITYLPGPNGTSTSSAQTLNFGGSVTLKDESAGFTRIGFSIVGWTTSSVSGAAKTNDLSSTYSTQSSITLYPVWAAGVYAITFDGQGATTAASGGSTTYTAATAIAAIPTTAPLRSGYNFGGWFTAATGGTQVTNSSYTPASPYGAITIYARWTALTNNAITYDGQGATAAASGGSTTYTTATAIATIPTTAPLRTGYNFGGWFTAATGGTQVTNASYTPSSPYGAITIYAQWIAITSNAITYDGQGATTAASGGSTTYTTATAIATIPTTEPLRTGHSFNGWFTAATGGTRVTNGSYTPSSPYGAITIYAQWTVDVYAINFNYGSASSGSPLFAFVTSVVSSTVSRGSYTYGDPALTLPTVGSMSKTGYTFAGWVLPNGNVLGTSTFTPTATTTLTAKWTIQSFSISYSRGTIGSDSVTGAAPASQSGNYLSTINLASTETSTDIAGQRYDFAGWTISGTRYPIGSPFQLGASNVIATASWVPVYTVTYILSGGVCVSATCNDNPKTDQSTVILPVAPSRTGYSFTAWRDQSGSSYAAGGTLTVSATSYILTATWLGIERSVTYLNPNGVGIPTQGNGIYQSTFDVGAAPTRTGYDFGGWSDQVSAIYQSGDIYSVGLTNVTLTATWIPLGIAVTFFNNDGTLGSSNQSITAGTSTPLTQNALTRAGYSFGGWNTSNSGGGTPYSDLQNVSIVSALNLYAQWTANTYTVTYNTNTSTSGTAPASQSYTTAGTALTIDGNSGTLARTGYTFAGWNTLANGSGNNYAAGATAQTFIANTTLYAKWTANTYSITYDPNSATSGTVPTSQSYTTDGSALTLASNSGTLARTGYTFSGWNTATDGAGTSYTVSQTNVTITANRTIYAAWTAKASRTLTFAVLAYSINIGDTVTATANLSTGSGPITYSAGISTACSVNSNTGLVTVTNGVGTCSISGSTPEDVTYVSITSTAPVVITVGFNTPAIPIIANVTASANTMLLTVTQSDLLTNGISNYKYSIDGTNYISIGSIASPLSISGLTPGIYSVRLKAVNPSGESAPSAALTVIVIAGPSVNVNVPSPAPAPAPSGPSAAEIDAINKAIIDKAYEEKEAADKKAAAEKAAADKAAADKAAADKLAAEKAAAEKEAAEKAAADKLAAEKAAAEKAAADKAAADKLAAEKAAAEKAAAEKAAVEKAIADKTAAEKAAVEKATADKLAAEKLAAEKLVAEQALATKLAEEKAAAEKLAACILGKTSTLVTSKSKTMSIYSQICFMPQMLKPIDKDIAEINKVISLIKSKKLKQVTLLSFADEKIGVDFKSVAKAQAAMVSGIIKKALPNLKVSYKLYGSSAKKNIVSQGRVVITAN
jgi:uncharacterized repeat protein (TIGR02543 family)